MLGIDYGKRKIGLAITDGILAEPYKVIRVGSQEEAIKKVGQVISSFAEASKDGQVGQVVIGISEGEMAKETREFGKKLKEKLNIQIAYQDETLTTQEAQEMSQKAGIRRIKRKALEDAYSATLILQSYLDSLTFKTPIPNECSTTGK